MAVNTIPLTKAKCGIRLRVTSISGLEEEIIRKLAVFGVFTGVEVSILQTNPVYVLRIGETQIALERVIASRIFVQKL